MLPLRPKIIATTIMEKQLLKMSQDALYDFLVHHDIKISRIADEMGVTPSCVQSCFVHRLSRHGKPRSFTVDSIAKLNEALREYSNSLRSCLLKFGTEQKFTNKHGRTYDPGMIENLNHLGEYLNLTAVVRRILGWSKSKKNNVFSTPSSKNYGNISEDDIDQINMEILTIVGTFDNIEVVPYADTYEECNSLSLLQMSNSRKTNDNP